MHLVISRKAETMEFGNCVDLEPERKRDRQRQGRVEDFVTRILGQASEKYISKESWR